MEPWSIKYLSILEYKPVNYVKACGIVTLPTDAVEAVSKHRNTQEFTANKERALISLWSVVVLCGP